MKKLVNKTKGLIRGTSTAVLLSVAIHAALFFGAGVWVVFRFIDAKEAKFVPQKIDRPKMKLKKLRVKVKEQSKPRKTTTRITSTRKSADLPDIQLPEMTGMGAGLEGAIGGFDMMADLSKMTLMGGGKSVGNDLEGTFYDLKRARDGVTAIPGMQVAQGAVDPLPYIHALNRFLENWSPEAFSEYYRSPGKLYATQFMVPPCSSTLAPGKFGINEDIHAAMWAIHYKGKIAHKTGGRFRFWGQGDDNFFVRLNGKVVLNASPYVRRSIHDPDDWQSSSKENQQYPLGNSRARVGDWFTLEPGVPMGMEALICEGPGGVFAMILLVEEEGVEYPRNEQGAPILPIFKTMETPEHLIDEIEYTLIPGQASLEGGPIFSVY